MPKMMLEKDGTRGLVPAKEHGGYDKAYVAYLRQLDPRNNHDLQVALADSEDVRFREFLDRLESPRYDKVNLATIAKGCCIDLKEFNEFWKKASVQRSIAIAQTRSVDITRDLVEDAKSRAVTCARCDGLKWIAAASGLPEDTPGYRKLGEDKYIRDCPDCVEGKVRKPGDAHARDKILEMSGLIQKGKGMTLVQNFGGAAHVSAVADLDAAMTIDTTGSEV